MKSISEKFFSTDEQKKICDAVHRAECKTSGEIVPMLVAESDDYPLAPIRGASFVALAAALLLTAPVAGMFWLHSTNLWVFLGLFAPIFLASHLLISRVPSLKRLFLFSDEMDARVRDDAFAAFFTERLYRTRDENGILIFISLFEHRAWIIADSGISERIPCEQWKEAVAVITSGIREKTSCIALCQAIEMVGAILEKEFPIREDDKNELHDLIIR
jgi:putative membrane protein